MRKNFSKNIVGELLFGGKKIILKTEWESFFVRWKLEKKFLHGDIVSAKIVKKSENNRMSEVQILKFLKSTNKILLWKKFGKFLFPLPSISTTEKLKLSENSLKNFKNIVNGTLVEFSVKNFIANIEKIFENSEHDEEIGGILFLNNISENWNSDIKKQEKFLKNSEENWKKVENNFRVDSLLASEQWISEAYKVHADLPYFATISDNTETRVDLRNWYTLTIDGADAKDLDDAISIARLDDGSYLLWVHIADVSHFVTEKSPIDIEARNRGTSIYLPEKVIPMLPETLSNHLCSLTPETSKKTLTALMKIEAKTGRVLHTDIFTSYIQSQHRGVYDEIFKNFSEKNFADKKLEITINSAFELFEILKKRRQKEGKISFETTELYFQFENNSHIPTGIKKRERNNAHILIEEFMVIANEEVAKWCTKRKIPFLSRIHDEPSDEWLRIIENILRENPQKKKQKKILEKITPKNIAEYLDNLDENARYHASKLIPPKMSKAVYSHNRSGHFGLALEFYSHFTSPIRRYPDLATHRMIHKYLEKNLGETEKSKAKKFLEKTAAIATMTEKRAENIENSVDRIYTLRFMNGHIGGIFEGKISGVADWGIFVELDIGVEITAYLPRFHNFQVDETAGAIINKKQEIIFQIWQKKTIKITKILQKEQRIIGEIIEKKI